MAGVKGAGGPPPKRSDQRRRRNAPAAGEPESAPGGEVVVPDADPGWHPVALRWFESLKSSGQSRFYESSDWGLAFLLAESMSRELNDQPIVVGKGPDATVEMHKVPPKGASLAAWLKGMTALLVSEGDRRRAALELQRPQPEPRGGEEDGSVTILDSWRTRTEGAG